MEVTVIKSKRRSMALQIKEGQVIVRAPQGTSNRRIREFLEEHRDWLEKNLAKSIAREEAAAKNRLSEEDIRKLMLAARKVIPERVRYYAPLVGVDYGKITIRCQRTKWGSCSSQGNLNFNCLLMLAPPQVLDGVVVHELCHRKEMNHSPRFYEEVLRVYPEYRKWDKWLKTNGGELMARARI